MRVLLAVEDDSDMVLLMKAMIEKDPELDLRRDAPNAAAGLEEVRKVQPDLVILDHYIRGRPLGIEAAAMIKRAAPNTKVLLFTAHDLHVEATREPAVDEFLSKENIGRLLPTIRALLGDSPAA